MMRGALVFERLLGTARAPCTINGFNKARHASGIVLETVEWTCFEETSFVFVIVRRIRYGNQNDSSRCSPIVNSFCSQKCGDL